MNNHSFVSVIVPVYNGEKTIDMCLKTLGELDWPKEKLELIVVDNKSTDRTCDIIKKHPYVRLLHENKILTASAARNRGIQNAKGDIIAFTDADCKPTSQWLNKLLKNADDQSIGCFIGEVKPLPPKNVIEKYFNENFWHNKPNEEGLPRAKTANCAYRKSVFEQIGLFDPELNTAEDSDLLHRFATITDLRWIFCENAVVEHKNKDTLGEFVRQFLRAGAWQDILSKKWPNHYKSHRSQSFWGMLKRVMFHLRGFGYRLVIYPFHSQGKKFFSYKIEDKKYHLLHPLLMIIVECCGYISSKYPNKFR